MIVGAVCLIVGFIVGGKLGWKLGYADGLGIGKKMEFTRIAGKLLDMDDENMSTHPHPGPCHRAHPGRKHVGSPEKNIAGED